MKGKNLFILFIGITLLISTCEKHEEIEISFEEAIQHEALSEEEAIFFDNLESIELSADEILLPNGLTVDDYLMYFKSKSRINGSKKSSSTVLDDPYDITNLMFAEIFSTALILTDRKRYQYEEAENAPKQDGLAYSYGQRDYTVREIPPYGRCGERLYGLDCSGFTFQLFFQSGIDLRNEDGHTWSEQQRNPDHIKNAIITEYDEMSEVLRVRELGKIGTTKFKSGDIIYFLKTHPKTRIKSAFHIGIVILTTSGELRIAQSNGVGTVEKSDECAKNYSIERGPRIVNLAPAVKPKWQGGLGSDYTIIRIDVESPYDFNTCYLDVEVPGQYKRSYGDTSYTSDADIMLGTVCYGSFSGNTFNGSYSETVGTELVISGTINAIIDDSQTQIDTITWNEQRTHPTYTIKKAVKAHSIPIETFGDEGMYFLVSGKVVTDHIITLKDVQTAPVGLNYTISDFWGEADSYIKVEFFNE
jgi:hypothetical protein